MDLDLHGAAVRVGRSYSWFQRHWRDLRHGASGALLPRPYIGGERGGRPRWLADDLDAWKAGKACAVTGDDSFPQREAANDPVATPPSDRAKALLQGAGS